MHKKYVFIDVDGTLIDHSTRCIPDSTKKAIKIAQLNGHEIIINTGRPPSLLYGIDKELGIESYVAANGRFAVHNGKVILNKAIDKAVIKRFIDKAASHKVDIGFEGQTAYKRQSSYDDLYRKFSENFNLEIPELDTEYYLNDDIYQIVLYYDKDDYMKFSEGFPELTFAYSCQYGIDVNSKGGLKEEGIEAFIREFGISHDDCIAIGDGHNDISMLQYAKTSVAMGNASDEVKKHATIITDHISNDGLYKAFKTLKLI